MSVKMEKLPSLKTINATIDGAARDTARKAQAEIRTVVNASVPRRSGRTQQEMQPRLEKHPEGWAVIVGPRRGAPHPSGVSVSQVVRWVNRGTGDRRVGGGAKDRIRPKRARALKTPFGVFASVHGQASNPFMATIAAATARVQLTFSKGATAMASKVERTID